MSAPVAGRIPAAWAPGPEELAGRVILVTGATGGLGKAAAAAMAGCGAELVLLGRNVPRLESRSATPSRGAAGAGPPSIR